MIDSTVEVCTSNILLLKRLDANQNLVSSLVPNFNLFYVRKIPEYLSCAHLMEFFLCRQSNPGAPLLEGSTSAVFPTYYSQNLIMRA
jgi:hypothetical protein